MVTPAKLLAVATVGAAMLAGLSFADARGLRRIRKLEQDVRQRQEKSAALEAENVQLRREIRALEGDPKALERAAREELGLVKDGEVVFTF
jgi:cell division protein FtsB